MIYLKAQRDKLNMTQKDVADKIGAAPSTIANYENGKREPDIETLCSLADVLNCSLDLLVRGKEKDRPEGRSTAELLNEFSEMSEAELHRLDKLVQAALADKAFQAHLRQDGQEAP